MPPSFDPLVTYQILCEAYEDGQHHLVDVDPEWKRILLNIASRKTPEINGYFLLSNDTFIYVFCNQCTYGYEEIHEHRAIPSDEDLRHLQNLKIFGDISYYARLECVEQHQNALEMLERKKLSFETLEIADFDGTLGQLTPFIDPHFKKIRIEDTRLNDSASNAFLIRVLKSASLMDVQLEKAILSPQVEDKIVEFLERSEWNRFSIDDRFQCTLSESFYSNIMASVQTTMEKWLERKHLRIMELFIGVRLNKDWWSLFDNLSHIGKRDNDHDFIVKHPSVEGVVARFSIDAFRTSFQHSVQVHDAAHPATLTMTIEPVLE
ncbi:hypothetical protein QR680_007137 [Steinernema hermaphroditum]|uniref:Uncharacterized protein n=1 Tax=Steinernema hermaphroditum TaxID=289476 RepID=A0AA39HXT0_9BILA|nr:hypothetical protein QR680_007137 [Steinernema hermaphroditum]